MSLSHIWQRLTGAREAAADTARWVVLDVESSGLDPHADRLLAIAAVALEKRDERLVVNLADSFETVLRQDDLPAVTDKANILVHGIGVGAQRAGVEPRAALAAFEAYVAGAPLAGFHVGFDRVLLERAARRFAGRPPVGPWLDLAELAPVLVPALGAKALDEWLQHFGITVAIRHQAAADTLATAELMQRLWPLARAQGATGFAALARLAAQRRWLQGAGTR